MRPGGVGVRRADVAPHHRRWHQRRRVALDHLALQRVVAVARPHPLGPGEDAEVDPRPARRAALDLHAGVPCAQLVEQRVQGERLGVGAGPAGRRGGLHVVAVHVPLDEGDVVVAEQRVEATEHLGVGIGVGEVEHELVAGEHRLVAGVDQRPLRVGAVEVAVGVDHLRLDPDPELHAERPRPARSAAPDRWDGRPVTPTSRRARRSSRRPPNHPSSRTNRSTPTPAARSARRPRRVEVVVEVHRFPGVEHAPGGGRAGWCRGARRRGTAGWRRCARRGSARRTPAACGTTRRARAPPRRAAAARRAGARPGRRAAARR